MAPVSKKSAKIKGQSYKRITTAIKINYLKKIDEGIGISQIVKSMQLPKSIVFNIKKDREKIEQSFSYMSCDVATKVNRNRNTDLLITETLLMTWITNQREKRLTLSQNLIKTKALSIFESLDHLNKRKQIK